MRINLDESLLVGHDLIDQDHRDLVPLVNIFLESIKNGADKQSIFDDFGEISVRFNAHFEHENQLMAESRYPDMPTHVAEHQALLGDLGKFLNEVEEANDNDTVGTIKYIEDWFLKHIAGSDRKLGEHLRRRAAKTAG